MKKVVKFGGSSLASAEQFLKVGQIILADDARRYVVPSAPGKRFEKDVKVTDMLYPVSYTHLRISLTSRCNLRCIYCMPEEDTEIQEEYLSFDEIERIVSLMSQMGIRHVRLTGGEPLLRKNIQDQMCIRDR